MPASARLRFVLVLALSAIFLSVHVDIAQALPVFDFSTTTIAFPSTVVGDTSAGVSVVVTNVTSSPQLLSSVAGGAPGDVNFTGFQTCGGVTLAAGASCAFTYQFVPQTVGPHSTTTSFSINGESSGTISLSGTGTATFSIAPTTLAFPSTVVGDTSAGIAVVVTNRASSAQLLSSVAGGAPGDVNFTGFQTCGGVTLAAGASCAFTYSFVPQTVGPHSTTTSFSINGQSSGTISLSGTGIPVVAPPTISKKFGTGTIPLNGTTSLTFSLGNPNATAGLTGVGFTDTLPAGLAVATPNGLSSTCGGTPTATAGSATINLVGGSIAATDSCTIAVNVTGISVGVQNNTTSTVGSAEGGDGTAASASITVMAPIPTLGGWGLLGLAVVLGVAALLVLRRSSM